MKIIFWGTPKYAAENLSYIIKAGHNVIAVVTQPDRKRGRGKTLSPSPVKQVALEFNIPVFTTESISKDENTKHILLDLKADIYLVVAFGQILPKEILDHPNLGCWNSHASLLPKWRGAAPIQWSILNNDSRTGVCIMAMEEGLDTGPVLTSEEIEIKDNDNLESITEKLCKISSQLLNKSLKIIEEYQFLNKEERIKKLNITDQSNLKGIPSYARQINKKDYLIDWNQSSRKIFNKIKGLYPNAYTIFNGKRIKILEVSIIKNEYNNTENILREINRKEIVPGYIALINKDIGLLIKAKDDFIQIKKGKLEGKRLTDGYTLSIQSNITNNDHFVSD